MAIKVKGIGHVALRCREENYQRLEQFFVEKMGFRKAFELINDHDEMWISYFWVAPGQYIEVLPGTPSSPCEFFDGTKPRSKRSYYHSCFEVNNRAAVVADLEKGKGIKVNRTPDDSVGLCKSHCLFINDPEGGEWELMEFTDQSLQIVND